MTWLCTIVCTTLSAMLSKWYKLIFKIFWSIKHCVYCIACVLLWINNETSSFESNCYSLQVLTVRNFNYYFLHFFSTVQRASYCRSYNLSQALSSTDPYNTISHYESTSLARGPCRCELALIVGSVDRRLDSLDSCDAFGVWSLNYRRRVNN